MGYKSTEDFCMFSFANQGMQAESYKCFKILPNLVRQALTDVFVK